MVTPQARRLRQDQTDAEAKLWSRLRRNALDGHHFRRQHPIGKYIVDFVCRKQKLIIEADGGQHADQLKRDQARTAYLESQGFRVVRFWNNEILQNLDGVCEQILIELGRE